MPGELPSPEGTLIKLAAAEPRFPVVSDAWRELLDDSAAYCLLTHAAVPLFSRLKHNLLVEFSQAKNRPIDDVIPFLNPTPLFHGLPSPFDRMVWRVPADLWADFYKFLGSVATVDPHHTFYSTVIAQAIPLYIGTPPDGGEREVVLVGVASTDGTTFFARRGDGTVELRQGPVLPDVRRTADALLGSSGGDGG
jgi:hypothetical protein